MSPQKRPSPRPAVRDYRRAERPAGEAPGPSPVIFTVPVNPKPWERAQSKSGQRFTAPATRAYQGLVRMAATRAGACPHPEPVRLVVRAYRATAQRCDLDNLVKTISDALNGVAYEDDSQIVELYALKFIDKAAPRAEIEVHPSPPIVVPVLDRDAVAAMFEAASEGL